ncbi:hypothetical protein SUGI_1049540 [Cryptomeria japonica]|uniref:uncharacterized protein LOC131063368 n=1 Tax=Cryptomeria japonica TaxID=3369 RepID=UPI00241493C5|nr:uncharacterized protein LOC131063368 [Cryptomeria japonica]GLJ49520.1 hypothetical protein SUGI_1049540 [Cryptomeria japonica]
MPPGSDLAGFESILRKVPWPVLRNPWLLKTEVYYFLIGEYWGHWNPTILVVIDPTGRILNKNAVLLVKRWGAEVYPFTDEKMKQLERQPRPRQPRQPRVDESVVKQRAEMPIPVTLSDSDTTRGGFRVDAPVDLRGTSGSSIVWPVWGCESELDPEDLSTQTALIIPGMPPTYF